MLVGETHGITLGITTDGGDHAHIMDGIIRDGGDLIGDTIHIGIILTMDIDLLIGEIIYRMYVLLSLTGLDKA